MITLPDREPVESYVYSYTVNGVVRYIGRGINGRYKAHLSDNRSTPWSNYLRKHLKEDADVVIEIVQDGLTLEQSNDLEMDLIEAFGRKVLDADAPLMNVTAGGEAMDSEIARMIAHKRNQDPAHIELQRQNALKQHQDPKQKEIRSEATKKQWEDPAWRAANIARLKAADRSKISKRVRCVETGVEYKSCAEAMRLTGTRHISSAANGSRKTAGGYHWEYI